LFGARQASGHRRVPPKKYKYSLTECYLIINNS